MPVGARALIAASRSESAAPRSPTVSQFDGPLVANPRNRALVVGDDRVRLGAPAVDPQHQVHRAARRSVRALQHAHHHEPSSPDGLRLPAPPPIASMNSLICAVYIDWGQCS